MFYTKRRIVSPKSETYLPFETPVLVTWQPTALCYQIEAEFANGYRAKAETVRGWSLNPYLTAARGLSYILRNGAAVERGVHIDTGAWVAQPDFDVGVVGKVIAEHQAYREEIGEEEYRARQAKLRASLQQVYKKVRSGELPWPSTVTINVNE